MSFKFRIDIRSVFGIWVCCSVLNVLTIRRERNPIFRLELYIQLYALTEMKKPFFLLIVDKIRYCVLSTVVRI